MTRTMITGRKSTGGRPGPLNRSPPRRRAPPAEPTITRESSPPKPKYKPGAKEIAALTDSRWFDVPTDAGPSSSKIVETRSAKRKRLAGEPTDKAQEEESEDKGGKGKKRTRTGNVRNAKKGKVGGEGSEEDKDAEERIRGWRRETQEVEAEGLEARSE